MRVALSPVGLQTGAVEAAPPEGCKPAAAAKFDETLRALAASEPGGAAPPGKLSVAAAPQNEPAADAGQAEQQTDSPPTTADTVMDREAENDIPDAAPVDPATPGLAPPQLVPMSAGLLERLFALGAGQNFMDPPGEGAKTAVSGFIAEAGGSSAPVAQPASAGIWLVEPSASGLPAPVAAAVAIEPASALPVPMATQQRAESGVAAPAHTALPTTAALPDQGVAAASATDVVVATGSAPALATSASKALAATTFSENFYAAPAAIASIPAPPADAAGQPAVTGPVEREVQVGLLQPTAAAPALSGAASDSSAAVQSAAPDNAASGEPTASAGVVVGYPGAAIAVAGTPASSTAAAATQASAPALREPSRIDAAETGRSAAAADVAKPALVAVGGVGALSVTQVVTTIHATAPADPDSSGIWRMSLPSQAPAIRLSPGRREAEMAASDPLGTEARVTVSTSAAGSAGAVYPLPGETGAAASAAPPAPATGTAIGSGPATAAPQMPQAQLIARQMAEAAVRQPDRSVELRLSPEELGPLRMTLLASGDGISVVVRAERAETTDLMRRNIDILAQEFRDIGYTDVSFSFADRHTPDPMPRAEPQDAADAAAHHPLAHLVATLPANTAGPGGLDLRL